MTAAHTAKKNIQRSVSVLICEDDAVMRETLKALILHMLPKARFFETERSGEGKDIVRSRNLDIVITDLHLNVDDSGESLAELAGSLGLMTILLTGDVAAVARHTNLAKHGVYILAKPVNFDELSSVVANISRHAS